MGSSDKTTEYEITADATGFKAGMDKAIQAAKDAHSDISTSMGGIGDAFNLVKGALLAFTAVLAGGKMFKEGIDETVQLTSETVKLSKTLGISMTEASGLNVALKSIGSSADVYADANAKLVRQVRTNEDAVKAMGVATRDANGEYVDGKQLMSNALEALKQYKEGTDRNLAAQTLFGKGAAETTALLKLNDEVMEKAAKRAAELGLVIGPEQAAKTKEYKEAMNDVKMVMSGIMNTIGQSVMPIFTQLAQWFSSMAPTAIAIFKDVFSEVGNLFQIIIDIAKELWGCIKDVFNAIGEIIVDVVGNDVASNFNFWKSLMAAVQVAALGLETGIVLVFEVIRGALLVTIERLKMFAAIASAAFRLDWAGVKAAYSEGSANIEKVIDDSQKRIVDKTQKNAAKIQAALLGSGAAAPDAAPKSSGGKSYTNPKEKESKGSGDKSQMQAWEAALAAQKVAYMKAHDMYEMSLEDEKKYWDKILAGLEKGDKEYNAVQKKSADTELKLMKKLAQDKRQLAMEAVEASKSAALSTVDTAQQTSQQQLELGQITKAQMIQQEQNFETQRYEIQRKALVDRLALLALDPTNNAVAMQKIKDQQLELERHYQLQRQSIINKAQLEALRPQLAFFQSMENSFSQSITDMLTRAKTLKQGLSAVFTSIYTSFINEFIAKKAAAEIAAFIRSSALGKALGLEQVATSEATAATQAATQKALGIAGVMSNSSIAATAAMASVAAIPFYGWAMAPAVGAETFAAGMAFLPSASKGYDIPQGVNPLTQLHEEEMVLPANLSNAVRDMANGGGQSGGDIHMHVHTQSVSDFKSFIKNNSSVLAPGLRNLARNLTPTRA